MSNNRLTLPRSLLARVAEFHRGFGAGADVEFFVDVLEVNADGFGRDTESVGDFLVGESFAEVLEDFGFAG